MSPDDLFFPAPTNVRGAPYPRVSATILDATLGLAVGLLHQAPSPCSSPDTIMKKRYAH
jgi:hypothetical protein